MNYDLTLHYNFSKLSEKKQQFIQFQFQKMIDEKIDNLQKGNSSKAEIICLYDIGVGFIQESVTN